MVTCLLAPSSIFFLWIKSLPFPLSSPFLFSDSPASVSYELGAPVWQSFLPASLHWSELIYKTDHGVSLLTSRALFSNRQMSPLAQKKCLRHSAPSPGPVEQPRGNAQKTLNPLLFHVFFGTSRMVVVISSYCRMRLVKTGCTAANIRWRA